MDQTKENHSSRAFEEGDLFYTIEEDEINLFKLLKIDDEFDIFHILAYRPMKSLPELTDENNFDVYIYHAPIDKNGFTNPKVLGNSKVTAADLSGYHEYLRQTSGTDEIISVASEYYSQGNELADERKFEKSIEEYSKAADLIPQFYEAIENRGFSRMSLGRFAEAIKDFEQSLEVFPESVSGIFSIGDCYLRMGKIKEAENWFKKVLEVKPTDELANKFLKHLSEWREKGLKDEESPETVAAFFNDINKK